MIRNMFRLGAAGLFAGAMMVSLGCEGGTGGSAQPTIDLTTKKAPPGGPGVHKVEVSTKK